MKGGLKTLENIGIVGNSDIYIRVGFAQCLTELGQFVKCLSNVHRPTPQTSPIALAMRP